MLFETKGMARACRVAWLLVTAACGSAGDAAVLYRPWLSQPGPRQAAFLGFSSVYEPGGPAPIDAADFPQRLSETGAFADVAALEPASGIVPYEIVSPLWSDGANKQRWISVPDGEALGYSESGPYAAPAGTVFVKHFEMPLDERLPNERRRLETRFWIAVNGRAQYGVSYRWNEQQTDAELIRESDTEELSIVGVDGETRQQPYFYPGPGDCQTCHNQRAGFVLGVRTAQLNRRALLQGDRPAVDQLPAWSNWGLLDTRLDGADVAFAPRLAAVSDESASLEERVRSYWDGNCAMCHAGADGVVPGWDARHSTAFEDQGLSRAPVNPQAEASQLIAPGSPDDSLIFRRSDTTEAKLRMPPLGRNRVDEVYVDVLARWISELSVERPPARE